MKLNNFDNILRFLNQLQQARISYNLAHHRDDARTTCKNPFHSSPLLLLFIGSPDM